MKITSIRVGRGEQPPEDVRVTRVAKVMIDAFRGHPEAADDVLVTICVADTAVHPNETAVLSLNVHPEWRADFLLTMLVAELKGSGRTVQIIDDRPQG